MKRFDVVATFEYEKRDGTTGKRYLRVGTAFEGDKGISLKLDSSPISKEWDGWLRLYEPKERDEQPKREPQRSTDDFDDTPF